MLKGKGLRSLWFILSLVVVFTLGGCASSAIPEGTVPEGMELEDVPEITISTGEVNVDYVSAKTVWDRTNYDRKSVVETYIDTFGVEPMLVPSGSIITVDFGDYNPDEVLLFRTFIGFDGVNYLDDYYIDMTITLNEESNAYEFIYGEEGGVRTETGELLGDSELLSAYRMTCIWSDGYYEADYGFILDSNGESVTVDERSWLEAESEFDLLEGVWMETEYETYPIGTTSVQVKWYNTINDEMMYGEHLSLEKEVESVWRVVQKPSDTEYGWNDIGYTLRENEQIWHTYGLGPFTYGLTEGHYRIATSFIRETIDGLQVDRPIEHQYSVYGYFYVGNEAVLRDMTNLYEDRIEVKDDHYGIVLYLPESWEGYSFIEEGPNSEYPSYELFSQLDPNYSRVIIRHPNWREEEPMQDIVLTIMNRGAWNNNANTATGGNFDLLPEHLPSGGDEIMLVKDEADYDSEMVGYDEVMDILENYMIWSN